MLGATKLTTRLEAMEGGKSRTKKNPGALGCPGFVVVGDSDSNLTGVSFLGLPRSTHSRSRPDPKRGAAGSGDTANERSRRNLPRRIHFRGEDVASRDIGVEISGEH
jgi:hypothetical protein